MNWTDSTILFVVIFLDQYSAASSKYRIETREAKTKVLHANRPQVTRNLSQTKQVRNARMTSRKEFAGVLIESNLV